jgi:hypothetical protein
MSTTAIRRCIPSIARAPRIHQQINIAKNHAIRYGRQFSGSAYRSIAVAEMTDNDFKSLKVKQDRLMADIHSTCEWGKGERWGE